MNAFSEMPLPPACQTALDAIERDALTSDPAVLAHLRQCPACAEARVQWLAQEEAPQALAPSGYFEQLPGRILRKLPVAHPHRRLWLAAATLLLASGLGTAGFWLGRSQQPSASQASVELQDLDTPFLDEEKDNDEAIVQLSDLSLNEANAVLERLESLSRPAAH
ncbi:MAG: hypothetical protein LWX11_03180 [Firmicutes bacterium]|nr:hypothetical protein [Bacillota bacterium]